MSPVSTESISRALDMMRSDPLIGYIGLKYNRDHEFKDKSKEDLSKPFLNKDELVKQNRINSMTALWRKEWLESLIKDHETPWEFDRYGSIRSRRTDKKVLIINNAVCPPAFDYQVDYQYGYGISMRKWLPKNKELFEKYGIDVNFDNLGIIDEESYQSRIDRDNGVITQNTQNKKERNWRESLYSVKKHIRKIRSLI